MEISQLQSNLVVASDYVRTSSRSWRGSTSSLTSLRIGNTIFLPTVTSVVPFSASTFMHMVGVVEMMVGILILTKWTRIGAYIASVWLLCIAFNLLLTGSYFDVAVRDVALAVGAWTLARLSEAHVAGSAPRGDA